MILISHRGNINGKLIERENHPDYIDEAIKAGFDVEIDIWGIDGELFLGHDSPQYKIDFEWLNLRNQFIWVHCKNIDALLYCSDSDFNNGVSLNYFWHETDTVTLTSQSWIWAYPGKQPIVGSIAVMPEIYNDDVSDAAGICSDYITEYK